MRHNDRNGERKQRAGPLVSRGELAEIQDRIGIVFRSPVFLERAFVHRSFLNEQRDPKLESNERLEFLGDAVLELAVTQYLYRKFPEMQEGKLTGLRCALVNTKMLGRVAEELGLKTYLRAARGQEEDLQTNEKVRRYLLACTFEAVIGAIYLDRGSGTVDLFLDAVLFRHLQEIMDSEAYIDSKSRLQELAQERLQITPHYEVLSQNGPDHEKTFVVGVFLRARQVGQGQGSSKSEAETEAAREALEKEFQVVLSPSAS
ncbi:ribonuclease III [Candidatus Kaiserbacteria bacterium]|nr:ribonuclease III [Candidatus Kaiserbacteria bacterium]